MRIALDGPPSERMRELDDGALLVTLNRAGAVYSVAAIAQARGMPYLQPLNDDIPVFLNSHRLAASHWLRAGDRLEFGGRPLEVREEPDGLVLATELPIALRRAPTNIVLAPPTSPAVRRQRRVAAPVVLVALALLALVLWYLFAARMVHVTIQPVPDRVSLQGRIPAIPAGGGYLVLSGTYHLQAERAGYRPLDTPVQITKASRQELKFSLEKLPGYLTIDTPGVAGAAVIVAGEVRGATPIADLELAAGEYPLVVRAKGYVDHTATLAIEGLGHHQKLEVALVPAAAAVTVLSPTANAQLLIDGTARSTLPFTAELAAGAHALEIRAPGHKPWRQEISVAAAQPQTIGPIALAPADGMLELSSEPSGASVTVDGKFLGATPLRISLAPERDHRVTLSMRGRETADRAVRLAADETRKLHVELAAVTGQVRLEVKPRDARLTVEGRSYGTAHGVHALPAVPQLLEITREGFAPGELWVTPKPGFEQTLQVTLRAAGTPASEGLPERITAPDGAAMVLLHPAAFTMGASRREPGQRANERLHPVKLVRPYYLATTEVTNEQFRRFRANHDSGRYGSIWLDAPQQPVVNVRWEDAVTYCNSLNATAGLPETYSTGAGGPTLVRPVGRGYRLPTEAEWAWAARYAGRAQATRFPWGEAMPPAPRSGNFADRTVADVLADTIPDYDDDYAGPAPVGQFLPSPAGLYDMAGNAAEWVNDVYSIQTQAEEETDPTGPPNGKHHVIRGSSWMQSSITALRWTYRDYGPDARPDVGFRCARYATEAP